MLAAAIAAVFTCTPIAVWDGDGPIHCAEGPRVRLAGIAARELDPTTGASWCRRGHPCPSASGLASRDRLVALLGGSRGRGRNGHVLVRGPRLTCRMLDDSYGRAVALCAAPGVGDLSCAMLRSGAAAAWPRRGQPAPCRS